MTSLTGLSPKNPSRYLGANVAINTVVTRTRSPTGADYIMPETGKLYPLNTFWLTGNNPTTGIVGDLWYLSKIVANVAYWIQLSPFIDYSNYTNVTHAMSPYTVLATDYYISCDTSGGNVQLVFPNSPTFKYQWVIKDRLGNAAVSNITLTTPGATVTFDGLTTYTMNSNYQAVNLLANAAPTYEVF